MPIGERCQTMFKKCIFNDAKYWITQAIFDEIEAIRGGGAIINREIVVKSLQVFIDMGLVQPKPIRTQEGLYVWQGERSLKVYNDIFEH